MVCEWKLLVSFNTNNRVGKEEVARVFVAIEISVSVRNALAVIQQRFQKSNARVSWVHPQNIHLSLAFLGDICAEVFSCE